MSLGEWIQDVLAAGGLVAFPAAFLGGVVMGMNPCCLALYPAAAASCCAGACDEPERPPLARALLFVFGAAIAMTALGIIAAVVGDTMSNLGGWMGYLVAAFPIVMGLQLLGIVRLPMPRLVDRWRGRSLAGAFFTGLLFSLVLSPCGTPALAAILSVAAFKGSMVFGALLLFAYGLGNGLPLLVVGTVAGEATRRLQRVGWARWLDRVAGLAMVVLGSYLVFSVASG